jgi:hypothetical protein
VDFLLHSLSDFMKKAAPKPIPHRNLSPYGWWIATYIERFEWKSDDRTNSNRRCLAYRNTILIKAKEREKAYKKAMDFRKRYSGKWESYGNTRKRPGRWVFQGLTSLLPIYDELDDGAEILWQVYSGKPVRKIKSLVKSKKQLECFID